MNTCYTSGFQCQIVDNYIFNTTSTTIYENIINPGHGCCVNATDVLPTRRFGRTFGENDPHRMLRFGLPPETAGWDDKIDGHLFRPNVCSDIDPQGQLNMEDVNQYVYRLSAMQTSYVSLSSTSPASISTKRNHSGGEVWCRNTLSTKVENISNLVPGLAVQPDIYNNLVDFDIVYDSLVIYTPDILYIERLNYDYNTGSHTAGDVSPVSLSGSGQPLIRLFFNEVTKTVTFGRLVSVGSTLIPELYEYNLDTGIYSLVYGNDEHTRDLHKYILPGRLNQDYIVKSVGQPHLTYNEILQKYTVSYTGKLEHVNSATDITEYGGDVFCVFVHNYKKYQTGLKHIDSILYHPSNKRELYRLPAIPIDSQIDIGSALHYSIGEITDPRQSITIIPKNLPVRESKLKQIIYRYDDIEYSQSRLPVNDMAFANHLSIKDMVESALPHRCGGPTDFASPRYQPHTVDLKLNLKEVSTVLIKVEAIYYDGHVHECIIFGEARPLPIDLAFGGLELVDSKSYTTSSYSSLLKLVFESQSPRYVTEIIIDNSGVAEQSLITNFDLIQPTISSEDTTTSPGP